MLTKIRPNWAIDRADRCPNQQHRPIRSKKCKNPINYSPIFGQNAGTSPSELSQLRVMAAARLPIVSRPRALPGVSDLKNFYSRATIAEESKLLYSLLDAAEEAGLLNRPDIAARWQELKRRVDRSGYEIETELCFKLLSEIDQSGALAGTWIRLRWLSFKHRIDAAPRRSKPREPDASP